LLVISVSNELASRLRALFVDSSTWERMADDNSRRYPPNLRGLLNFCTECTQAEDASSTSDISVMSEEVISIQICSHF